MTFKPTDEQQQIIEHVGSGESLLVEARAGAAKTTTIVLAANEMPHENALALAFNKKIQMELDKKLPFKVQTLNGLGHGVAGGRKVSVNKMKDLREKYECSWDGMKLASKAKTYGVVHDFFRKKGFMEDSPEVWEEIAALEDIDFNEQIMEEARKLLQQSTILGTQGDLDFDDQLYLPVFFGGKWPVVNTVFVDEAQDLSPLNRVMISKIKFNQLVVVGDPLQSIYAWRGADSQSMNVLREEFSLPTKYLTTCFRCPKSVIDAVKPLVPDINSPEWAIEGEVNNLFEWSLGSLPAQATFICRNNAPLISMALKVAKHSPIAFIGAQKAKFALESLLREVDRGTIAHTISATIQWLEKYEAARPHIREYAEDKAQSLVRVLQQSTDTTHAKRVITQLFANQHAPYIFSTGHGAKGLEWPNVVFLNKGLIPSSYAQTEEDFQQEDNLKYVIMTRAQERLFFAETDNYIGD